MIEFVLAESKIQTAGSERTAFTPAVTVVIDGLDESRIFGQLLETLFIHFRAPLLIVKGQSFAESSFYLVRQNVEKLSYNSVSLQQPDHSGYLLIEFAPTLLNHRSPQPRF